MPYFACPGTHGDAPVARSLAASSVFSIVLLDSLAGTPDKPSCRGTEPTLALTAGVR